MLDQRFDGEVLMPLCAFCSRLGLQFLM